MACAGAAQAQTKAQPGGVIVPSACSAEQWQRFWSDDARNPKPMPPGKVEFEAVTLPVAVPEKSHSAAAPAWSSQSSPVQPAFQNTGSLPSQEETIVPASCRSCGRGLLGPGAPCSGCCPGADCPWPEGCPTTQCGQCCVPGRTHCCSYCDGACCGKKMLCGIYHCVCCPDPCYEPRWIAAANSAFWVDDARPVSHTRLRFHGAFDVPRPDRAEYFVQQFTPNGVARRADFREFHLYNEIAFTPKFAFFIDMPWRSTEFETAPASQSPFTGGSGFGDMFLGTKSVLLDCDLLLVTFQFTTYIPTGKGVDGLGTGHTTLEPALLAALKLTPRFYLQYQTALAIPISGGETSSNVWRNNFSFNYVLYRFLPDVELIGTMEFVNFAALDATYTEPEFLVNDMTVLRESREWFFHGGPGLRLNICNHIDFGAGAIWSLSDDAFLDRGLRAEFRWRY